MRKRFEKWPEQKLSPPRILTILAQNWRKTFEMVLNELTYGFLNIFFNFLTISEKLCFFKLAKMCILGQFFSLNSNYSKTVNDIKISTGNSLNNVVVGIL